MSKRFVILRKIIIAVIFLSMVAETDVVHAAANASDGGKITKIMKDTYKQTNIAAIHIGPEVTYIEDGAFNNQHFLYKIEVDEGNPNYCSYSNCLYDKEKTKLICFPQGLHESYIPKTCTKLEPGCLSGKSRSLRYQVKKCITYNNDGEYPEDYPGYDMYVAESKDAYITAGKQL